MATVPAWATELVERVCLERGAPVPEISWQRSAHGNSSSGRAWPTQARVHVRAGKYAPRAEQRQTLLHELAHHLLPAGEHHSPTFYALAFTLYRTYGVKLRPALVREREYHPRNAPAGYRMALEQARELEAVRPAAMPANPANTAALREQIEALEALARLAAAYREAEVALDHRRAELYAGVVQHAGTLTQPQIAEAVELSVPRVQQVLAEGRSR